MRFSTLAALATAGTVHAQQPATPSVRSEFVVTAGGDTIAIERITRDAALVESDLLVKAQGARITFTMSLAPDATAPKLVTEARPADAPTNPRAMRSSPHPPGSASGSTTTPSLRRSSSACRCSSCRARPTLR